MLCYHTLCQQFLNFKNSQIKGELGDLLFSMGRCYRKLSLYTHILKK